MVIFLVIAGLIIFFVVKHYTKRLKPGNLTFVSGGVKSGKTTFTLYLALKIYRRMIRRYYLSCLWIKISNPFRKLFRKPLKEYPEKPLFYSNIPLKMNFVPLTDDLLLRKKRFVFKSVVFVSEASLVADSMTFRDMDINNRVLLFNKLIAHELHGGYIFYESQNPEDTHYNLRRSISTYYFIQSTDKFIPFILISNIIEVMYSDNGNINFAQTVDVDDLTRKCVYLKRVWKKFDCYTYSSLTDDLPVEKTIVDGKKLENLKTTKIVSLKDYNKIYLDTKKKKINLPKSEVKIEFDKPNK